MPRSPLHQCSVCRHSASFAPSSLSLFQPVFWLVLLCGGDGGTLKGGEAAPSSAAASASAGEEGSNGAGTYALHDRVPLYVNKVGPYYNPHETYHYYQLPVCRPKHVVHKSLSLGELLDGDRMANSMYEIRFGEEIPAGEPRELCQLALNVADIQALRNAIEELYYFEFVVDNIPVRGFVGNLQEGNLLPHVHRVLLYTHHHFRFEYNGQHIIYATVTSSGGGVPSKTHQIVPTGGGATAASGDASGAGGAAAGGAAVGGGPGNTIDLKELEQRGGGTVSFTYSVEWVASKVSVAERDARLTGGQNAFFPKSLEIHWLSIINSLILVVLLLAFIAIILARIVRRDFAQLETQHSGGAGGATSSSAGTSGGGVVGVLAGSTGGIDEAGSEPDEIGWKLIHADVFRPPPHKSVFSAILGCGAQFLAIATGIMAMALAGLFNVHRHGSINAAAVVLYALTSGVAGYVSASMYRRLGGTRWVANVNLTSLLFAAPFLAIWSVCNSVAWAYGTTHTLPATTVLLLACLWLLVGYPLTVGGAILARQRVGLGRLGAPCRTRNIPRELPRLPWYKRGPVQACLAGFLPFSAISVELYYVLATVWGRHTYTLYGILCIVYFILIGVTCGVSVALTYLQLVSEDYRWWWRSVYSLGSTGGFVFAYALFHFVWRSFMSGAVQTVEFVGYTLLIGYVFFLALGTLSFFVSFRFVRFIYANIKMD